MDLIVQCLILSLASAVTLLYLLTRARASSSRNGQPPPPPGPWPLPIVGNLFLLGDQPHRSLARLSKTHGPLMSLQLGRTTTIVVSSPDVARDILQKHDTAFSSRSVPDAIRALRHDQNSIGWLPAAVPWRNLRRICSTQLFIPQRISSGKEVRSKKARELVARVRERCSAGEAVDIGSEAFDTIVDLITNTFFSVDAGGLVSGTSGRSFREVVLAIMEEAGKPNVSDIFPAIAAVDLQGRRRQMAAYFGTLHEVFDEIMERRMKEGGRNDFLNYLMQGDGDRKLDPHAIKSLLTDLFIAGTDTSSNTVEWAMAELLRNPTVMTKAQEELARTIGTKEMADDDDIARLPYLQAIVKETLRLHPSVPFLLPRRAEMNIELRGYTIQKGARVFVNVWAMGRDPNIWEDPDAFMPERFIGRKDIDYKGQDFELIPFGAGRRICPGLPLAFQMVHIVLASFLHSFNWKLPDDGMDVDMAEKFGVTLAKAIPLRAIPILNMC